MTNPSTPPNPSFEEEAEEILQVFSNTIALGIMGNVPGAEGVPVYTDPGTAIRKLINAHNAAIAQAVREELESLQDVIVAHHFDTTAGRRIDDEINKRIAAREGNPERRGG